MSGKVSNRDEMLRRIRAALGHPPAGPSPVPAAPALGDLGPVMPPIHPAELVLKFESEMVLVGGQIHRAQTSGELDQILTNILTEATQVGSGNTAGPSIVLSRNPLLTRLDVADRLGSAFGSIISWPGPSPADPGNSGAPTSGTPVQNARQDLSEAARNAFKEQCFQASVGITGVDFALAESGTLVVSSETEGSQLASLAPPVHIALYSRNQLVATLEEVLENAPVRRRADAQSSGRSVVFITGTSRTADIEQILIRGVHGPREVHAILVEESCLNMPAS